MRRWGRSLRTWRGFSTSLRRARALCIRLTGPLARLHIAGTGGFSGCRRGVNTNHCNMGAGEVLEAAGNFGLRFGRCHSVSVHGAP